MNNLEEYAESLSSLDYEAIELQLDGLVEDQLILLLNAKSTKVGDTAADILWKRGCLDALMEAVFAGTLNRKNGKMRALNILLMAGKGNPNSIEVYCTMLQDKSVDVVDSALFGLVFWQDKGHVRVIREARTHCKHDTKRIGLFDKAIEALTNEDPFIYSTGFHDLGDVWKLDKDRFGDRIGPL